MTYKKLFAPAFTFSQPRLKGASAAPQRLKYKLLKSSSEGNKSITVGARPAAHQEAHKNKTVNHGIKS